MSEIALDSIHFHGEESHLNLILDNDIRHTFPVFSKDGTPVHVGIMGGTFDPIHFGHLACAQFALDSAALDAVLFIPAGIPTFKQGADIACAKDRLAMVRQAISGNNKFFASDIETTREGVTFTIDTMRSLKEHYSDEISFSFILGTDALLLLEDWKEIEELAKLVNFICIGRPGYEIDEQVLDKLKSIGVEVELVCAPLLDISSTELRERVGSGLSIRYLAPLSVCNYISDNGLYI